MRTREILCVVAALTCAEALGSTTNWTGSAGNSLWVDPLNWSAGVPGAADTAVIVSPTSAIQLPSNAGVDSLLVSGTVDLAGGILSSKTVGMASPTSAITSLRANIVAGGPELILRGGESFTLNGSIQGSDYRVSTSGSINLAAPTSVDQSFSVTNKVVLLADGTLPSVQSIDLIRGEFRVNNSSIAKSNRLNSNATIRSSDSSFFFLGGNVNTDITERVGDIDVSDSWLNMVISSVGRNVRLDARSLRFTSGSGLPIAVNGTTTRLTLDTVPTLYGGTGGVERGILRHAYGIVGLTGTDDYVANLLTYDSQLAADGRHIGVRPLRDDEFLSNIAAASSLTNVRITDTQTMATAKTINALRIDRTGLLTLDGDLTLSSGIIWNNARGTGGPVYGINGSGAVKSDLELHIYGNASNTPSSKMDIQNDIEAPGLACIGRGAVRLSGNNTLPGGIQIGFAQLTVDSAAALGSGDVTIRGGTLRFEGSQTVPNTIRLAKDGSGSTIVVPTGASVDFDGPLTGDGYLRVSTGFARFNSGGDGSSRLGSVSTFENGQLELNGIWPVAGPIGGSGNIFGNATIPLSFGRSGGTVSPGPVGDVGLMHIYELDTGAGGSAAKNLKIEINAAQADRLIIDYIYKPFFTPLTNQLFNLQLNVLSPPAPSTVFTILELTRADLAQPQFAGLAEGALITSGGSQFRISYVGGDGNDVTLTVLPEPTGLALFGLLGIIGRRTRYVGSAAIS